MPVTQKLDQCDFLLAQRCKLPSRLTVLNTKHPSHDLNYVLHFGGLNKKA